jgi:hypothetical protein
MTGSVPVFQAFPKQNPLKPGLRSFRIQQVIFRAMQHKAGRPGVIHHIKGALKKNKTGQK